MGFWAGFAAGLLAASAFILVSLVVAAAVRGGRCIDEFRQELDALTWPLSIQQWREMELTFYTFRERLQGKPVQYLSHDVDAPPASAEFMAKLEARLNPGQSKSSGTG